MTYQIAEDCRKLIEKFPKNSAAGEVLRLIHQRLQIVEAACLGRITADPGTTIFYDAHTVKPRIEIKRERENEED